MSALDLRLLTLKDLFDASSRRPYGVFLFWEQRGKDDKKIIRDQERVGRKIALRKWWCGITSTAHKDTNMSNPLAAYSLTASHGTSNSLAGGNCSEPLSTCWKFSISIGKDKMLLRSTEKVSGIFGYQACAL